MHTYIRSLIVAALGLALATTASPSLGRGCATRWSTWGRSGHQRE